MFERFFATMANVRQRGRHVEMPLAGALPE
jgi:hypothetical protein